MDYFLRTGEYRFFEKYFDMYCFEDETPENEVIKFDHFQQICYETEKFNRDFLPGFLEKIRRLCRDKLRNKGDEILINRQEFFGYIELVVRDNDKTENERDPELKDLFNILAYDNLINKKKFVDIINSFGLPLNIDEFLGPLRKKEDINFNEFCSLFKKKTDETDLMFATFYSSFYNTKESIVKNRDQYDNFPIKFNVREEN
jgi:hypothetical protein